MKRLEGPPAVPPALAGRLAGDHARFRDGMPPALEDHVREAYGIDLASSYALRPVRNPFGKASGQLSLAARQLAQDAADGLGFSVLKTVIAEDAQGNQAMKDWAVPESRMTVEPIVGASGEAGWTVSWTGRGWSEGLPAYLRLFREALGIGKAAGLLVVPSCKYPLPAPGEDDWRQDEYAHTTRALREAWTEAGPGGPMPLEKDFSPTLAGSDRARERARTLEWLGRVPGLVRAAAPAGALTLGVKVMNARFEDGFQMEMLSELLKGASPPDFLVYANRLFDPSRELHGKRGLAYGGPDLSDRNLAALSRACAMSLRGELPVLPPLSATGNVASGRTALEYALRGASSLQVHTFFQLPDGCYAMRTGSKVRRALHALLFDPSEGLIAWMLHAREKLGLEPRGGLLRFEDLAAWHRGAGRERMLGGS